MAFTSNIFGMNIFDSRNSDDLVKMIEDPSTPYHGGFVIPSGMSSVSESIMAPREFADKVDLIPRDQWAERIEELEKTKSRLIDLHKHMKIPILDQARNGYCWCFGMVGSYMMQRGVMGLETRHLSAASLAAQIKNGRNQGGWAGEALRGLPKYGIYLDSFWPEQSRDLSYVRKANEEQKRNAMKYKVPLAMELPGKSFDHLATMLLRRFPTTLGLGWWGHLVYALDLVQLGRNDWGVIIANSWTERWEDGGFGVLREDKARADEQISMVNVAPY